MGWFESFTGPRKVEKTPAPPVETPSAWKRPVAELAERVDYLEEALNRLRGRVTGNQKRGAPQDGAESSEVDRKPAIVPEPDLDRWQLLSNAKRAKRGVLQG